MIVFFEPPHKVLKEFLAALNIFMTMETRYLEMPVRENIDLDTFPHRSYKQCNRIVPKPSKREVPSGQFQVFHNFEDCHFLIRPNGYRR